MAAYLILYAEVCQAEEHSEGEHEYLSRSPLLHRSFSTFILPSKVDGDRINENSVDSLDPSCINLCFSEERLIKRITPVAK